MGHAYMRTPEGERMGETDMHALPEITDDGFVKGITVYLCTEDWLVAHPRAIRELLIREWGFEFTDDEKPTCLYHCDFYGLLQERYKQNSYLRDLLPFDTTQFLVNIAYMIGGMGVIYNVDVEDVKSVTEDAWLSAGQMLQDN